MYAALSLAAEISGRVRISFALAAQFLPGQASFRVTSTTVRRVGAPVTFLIVSMAVRSGVVCSTAFPESVVAVPKCSFQLSRPFRLGTDEALWGPTNMAAVTIQESSTAMDDG